MRRVALVSPGQVLGADGEVLVEDTGEQHGEIVFRLLEETGTAGNLTTDAHLAALALEYQAEIASTDNDFARFRGLRWFNPVSPRIKKR